MTSWSKGTKDAVKVVILAVIGITTILVLGYSYEPDKDEPEPQPVLNTTISSTISTTTTVFHRICLDEQGYEYRTNSPCPDIKFP